MAGLGGFIQKLRKNRKLTRQALAEGICSEKTIYYIEKEMRFPSANLLASIGNRLGVDIFEYLPFIDFEDPEAVKDLMDQIEGMRNSTNCEQIMALVEASQALPDASAQAFQAEMHYNRLFCALSQDEALEGFESLIEQELTALGLDLPLTDTSSFGESLLAQKFINLLGIYHMKRGDFEQGGFLFECLSRQVEQIKYIKRHQKHYVSIKLNYLHTLRQLGLSELLLNEATALLAFQKTFGKIDRLFMIYWFIGYAQHNLGNEEASAEALVKMFYAGALRKESANIGEFFKHAEYQTLLRFFEADTAWYAYVLSVYESKYALPKINKKENV